MRFKKIYIEIQNTCNLQCQFCIQNQRKPKAMTLNEFSFIISQIKPYTNYVYLHVMGEPLMHPQLPAFIALCNQENIHVNITTNGTLLKDRIMDLEKLDIRQLNISLHSYEEHHQKNYLQDIIGSVRRLSNTYVAYRLWSMKNGVLKEKDKNMLTALADAYHINITPEMIISKTSIKLQDKIFINFDEVFQWPSLQNPFLSDFGTCHGFLNMCAILSDGTVVPCCLDSLGDAALGNIHEQSFREILENDNAQTFLHHMKQHKLTQELCCKCSYRLRFNKE